MMQGGERRYYRIRPWAEDRPKESAYQPRKKKPPTNPDVCWDLFEVTKEVLLDWLSRTSHDPEKVRQQLAELGIEGSPCRLKTRVRIHRDIALAQKWYRLTGDLLGEG
jgi:hypothetical protein